MSKGRATIKKKFQMNGKTSVIEVPMFQPSGHVDYSGFGFHGKTNHKSERRKNRTEARNIMRDYF
jgi:hypothetical protein